MKTTFTNRRRLQRAWVLWAFLAVVAGAVALCKVLINMANQMNPPAPPPPAQTNQPPFYTNALPFVPPVNIAVMDKITGDGDLPANLKTVTFSFGPAADGSTQAWMIGVASVDASYANQTSAQYNDYAAQWYSDWGVNIGYGWENYGITQYIPAPQLGPGWYQFVNIGPHYWPISPPIMTLNSNMITTTIAAVQQQFPAVYAATLQRLDAVMANPVDLATATVTAGTTCTFLDTTAPTNAAFYRVSYRPQ